MKKISGYIGLPPSLSIALVFLVTCFNAYSRNDLNTKTEGNKYPAFYHRGFIMDGRLTDWPSGMFYNNSEASVLYAVANDSTSLYFCIQILEQSAQLNALHDGLIISINIYGKKKEFCQIYFPYEAVKINENKDQTSPRQTRSFSASMKMEGFNEDVNGIYRPGTLFKGVETAIAYDSTGSLVLEMAVPLAGFTVDLRTAKYATFGFVIHSKGKGAKAGVPDKEGGQGGGKHSGGQGGGGSGGMGGKHGGGGGSGSGRGHSPNGQGQQSQNNQFKISHKFAIARLP
jgi:hypothetical protein